MSARLTAAGGPVRHVWAAPKGEFVRIRSCGDQKVTIERGWNGFTSPETYREMGTDPKKLIKAGIEALKERYGD